jgi:hypothetical protein
MGLVTITAASIPPVTTAEMKSHLRIDFADDDTVVTNYVDAATEYLQDRLRRQLITQTFELTLDAFPNNKELFDGTRGTMASADSPFGQVIQLPMSPIQTITTVKYIDTDGNEQTLSSALYQLDETAIPGRLSPAYNQEWPDTRPQLEAVAIRFVAGHGDAITDVPENLRQAVMLLAGHWYESREATQTGNVARSIPFGVDNLINDKRVWEII